jgi:membrane associated rhomboid family serine protease
MGLQDREYYRDDYDQPGGIQLGGQWSMVTTLIVINAGFFLVNLFLGGAEHRLTDWMSVRPDTLLKPWLWWQFVSYGFAHSPIYIGHIFWNMFGLFIFGREVEGIYGRKEFLKFYLVAIFLGGLLWALKEYGLFRPDAGISRASLIGASGAITAVILLFVLHFPKRTILLMFVLPVPAWVVGVMMIFGNLFSVALPDVEGNTRVAYDVHLVGAAFAICYFKFGWRIGRVIPDFNLMAPLSWAGSLLKSRPKLRVHDPDSSDKYRDLDEQADRLLDKVHREGEASLTSRERRVLEEYSRRMRQKRR